MNPYRFETKIYVPDTNAIISYYSSVFRQLEILTPTATKILDDSINDVTPFIKLSIPAVVFVEIFDKWLTTEEFAREFYFEVFEKLKNCKNVEFREIDKEVLLKLVEITGILSDHEMNDKLILASAMVLNCQIITTDQKIHDYVDETGVIPGAVR